MSRRQRITAVILCVLFAFGLARADAAQDGIYFVALENMVLPLTEETMPFWNDGYLYISSDVFTGNARDALGISRAKIGDAILLYRGEKSLLFRHDSPYVQDSQERLYSPGIIWRGENSFIPAYVVAQYFDLLYSSTDVEHGKLVWLRSASFGMKERAFAKAATFQLETAYREYVRALEPESLPETEPAEEPEPLPETEPAEEPQQAETLPSFSESSPDPMPTEEPETVPLTPATSFVTPSASESKPVPPSVKPENVAPAAPSKSATPSVRRENVAPSAPSTSTPVTPSASVPDPEPVPTPQPSVAPEPAPIETPPPAPETNVGGQRIYLCLRGNGVTSSLLDALDRRDIRATVFCDEDFLSEQGDLLRRMVATGHRIGLYVPAGNAVNVLEHLETCNLLLRRTTMEKTRLVFIDGAGEELFRAARNAGFLCLRPTLDRTDSPLRTSRQADDLLKAVSGQSETLSVWIGGTVSRSGLNAFLADALEVGDALLPWTETAAA